MKKVYCDNCKYIRKTNRESGITHFCILEMMGSNNLNYNCKFYKRKWWKFWVKEDKFNIDARLLEQIANKKPGIISEGIVEKLTFLNNKKKKRKILKGCQPETDAGPKPNTRPRKKE